MKFWKWATTSFTVLHIKHDECTLKAFTRGEKSCWSAARARTRASFLTWLERALSPSLRSLVGFYARASKSASAQSGNPPPPRALEAVERELLCLEYRVCCPLVKKWFSCQIEAGVCTRCWRENYEGGSVKLQGLKFVRYVIFWNFLISFGFDGDFLWFTIVEFFVVPIFWGFGIKQVVVESHAWSWRF